MRSPNQLNSKVKILVVEDERLVALDLQGMLEDLGYDVVGVASSSEDALALVSASEPQLVLMDIRLEGRLDGIETAALMRRRLKAPIVYLTANADPATLQRALETEPAGYLAKPFSEQTLRATIEVALRRYQAESNLEGEKAQLTFQKRAAEENASELATLAEKFKRDSLVDPLTGLFNRRQLESVLSEQLALARREGSAVSVIILDVDKFKNLNDTYGHACGDQVLKAISTHLRARIRDYDIACRYGGEEMVVVVPGASVSDACAMAEKLRTGIEGLSYDLAGRKLTGVTASFGVACYPNHRDTPEGLLQAADAALYQAKAEGRNRVCAALS
jgi:diguanylate cyclase (GGDEF)-like protein